jgi:ABC-type transport system involved in multi-copper enzyme maturation permease subunit
MALRMSSVSRNLNAQVMFLGLEFEDLLVIIVLGVAGMLIGHFFFSDRYLFFLPMNWALLLIVIFTSIPGLMLLKYGKPRGYTGALFNWYTKPRAYSGLEPDTIQNVPYIAEETEEAEENIA